MKPRTISKTIKKALRTFPALVLTGPRQSGKTTLLKNILSGTHAYCNLEDPDTRLRAKADPRGFLENFAAKPVILDEIQYVTELLPYIKAAIDEKHKSGRWVLTGSQNFTLMHGVSESLAGRVAVLSLLPFSFSERIGKGSRALPVDELIKLLPGNIPIRPKEAPLATAILRGNYPGIAAKPSVNSDIWCGSYIATYLERDIRNLTNVGDLSQFERFLRVCAVRTGQILNISEIAKEIGVSVPTAKRWLSLLETGYQIYLLYPYYKNIGKRLVKSPKLYFTDTALSCYLMGLREPRTLLHSPYFSHIFETFVVIDFWKRFVHSGKLPSMFYIKTRDGLEVDLALEINQCLHLFEIKGSSTITPAHASSLLKASRDLKRIVRNAHIISLTRKSFALTRGIHCYPWGGLLSL